MTDLARQTALQIIRLPGDRAAITGPPARVALALDQLRYDGRLIGATDPAPTADGGVLVTVRLAAEVARRPAAVAPAATRRTPARLALAGAVAFAALAAAAALVLPWLAAHWAIIVGLAALAVIGGRRAAARAVQVIVSVTVR